MEQIILKYLLVSSGIPPFSEVNVVVVVVVSVLISPPSSPPSDFDDFFNFTTFLTFFTLVVVSDMIVRALSCQCFGGERCIRKLLVS